jgi:predicted ATP-grasp superfamily ATP-dependent carboligase
MIAPAPVDRGTVLVTDTDRGSALAVIRSLGRAGFRVVAADGDPRSLGFRSRYAAERVVLPPAGSDPRRFMEALLEAVRDHRVDLVIPVTDEVIQILARHRRRFEGLCRLAIAEPRALRSVSDKARTVRLARRLGVPVPRTAVVRTTEEALQHAASVGFPLAIKAATSPRYDARRGAFTRHPVCYAADTRELALRLRRFAGCRKILLQEYCRGVGCGVEMLAWKGRPVAAFQHRRLAEIPVSGGASAWRESVALDPRLYAHSARLVAALGWTGLIMVEFKVGTEARFMEINGRVWGSLPLAVMAGMDFPARFAAMCLDGAPPDSAAPDTNYRLGLRAHNLELVLLWIAQVLAGRRRYPFVPMPPRREALAALVGLFDPAQKLDVACRDDPRPAVAEIGKIARKLLGKLRGPAARQGASHDR